MKNVISTTLFEILSQESHQNLIWKVVTSSNLNPPLKLYFYSPILANNNMLLKIYYENIVVAFLNCIFPFFLSIIHTFPFSFFFFFFFSLDFSPPHTYTHYLHPLLFFFSTFHFIPKPPSLFLSLALFLYFFFFFFYLILKHYPTLSVIRNGERGRERKNRWVRWLRFVVPSLHSLCRCAAATACLPPQRSPDGRWLVSFFFFLIQPVLF